MRPVTVGLVGAGGWARGMHASMHTAGGETQLTGVWSRRPEAAREVAASAGVTAYETFDELLDHCEAVDFAVPPAVQAELAMRAARAGKALLLEKPLAASLQQARVLADVVAEHGVATLVVHSKRYHPATREFLGRAAALRQRGPVVGVSGCFLHGGFLSNGFLGPEVAGTWRLEPFGVLLDLGPHLLDLAQAAAGPIVAVRADGDPSGYLTVDTVHADGAVGQFALSGRVAVPHARTVLDLWSEHGEAHYSAAGLDDSESWRAVRAEFAAAVREGAPVTVDVNDAVQVQAVLEAAARSHGSGWRDVEPVPVVGSGIRHP